MPEYRLDQAFDVVWKYEAPALDHCQGLRGTEKRNAPARADPKLNIRVIACAIDQLEDVIHYGLGQMNFAAFVLKEYNFGWS